MASRMATSFSASLAAAVTQTCPLVATVRNPGGSVAVAAPRVHEVAFVHARCRAKMLYGVSPYPLRPWRRHATVALPSSSLATPLASLNRAASFPHGGGVEMPAAVVSPSPSTAPLPSTPPRPPLAAAARLARSRVVAAIAETTRGGARTLLSPSPATTRRALKRAPAPPCRGNAPCALGVGM